MPVYFSVRAVEFQPTPAGVNIRAWTDIPCHLFVRLSRKKPWIHKKPSLRRGVAFAEDVRFCFTVYEDNEQSESGDTLIHNWSKTDWPPCTTKYLYFWGYVSGAVSVSSTAFFNYHHPVPIEPVPSGECYLLTNCAGYGALPQGNEYTWCFVPVEDFSTNHCRLWLADYFGYINEYHLYFRIYSTPSGSNPQDPPLAESEYIGQLPQRPDMQQMDFTFPLIELSTGHRYSFGFLNKYVPYTCWLHRSHSFDKSNCFIIDYYSRVQYSDLSYGNWSYAKQNAQPCHQFFIDP